MPPDHSKKRKRGGVVLHQESQSHHSTTNTSKPSAIFKPTKGRQYTVSIALPGSVIANALTHDLKTALAGQIARAAAVFCVDEIIIFNDGQSHKSSSSQHHHQHHNERRSSSYHHSHNSRYGSKDGLGDDGHTGWSDPDYFLYHILTYLETPPHLRKALFPIHPNLRTAGTLPSLDMPHHMRPDEWCQYREGVTVDPDAAPSQHHDGYGVGSGTPQKKRKSKGGSSSSEPTVSYVEAGLGTPIRLDAHIPLNTRVTLKFDSAEPPSAVPSTAEAVAPSAPREEAGYFWGYSSRIAPTLSSIFTECPFEEGYDLSIGTSERGASLASILPAAAGGVPSGGASTLLPSSFKHLLLVFGGVAGLESAVPYDNELSSKGITRDSVSELFDAWVNVLPGQGSRTIRTEEAVWLALMGLREFVQLQRK